MTFLYIQTFVYREFKYVLLAYADSLVSKMPKPTRIGGGPEAYKINDDKMRDYVCHVINTSEYCAVTVPKLSENILSKIDEAYKDQVDFEPVESRFFDVVNIAVNILVSAVDVEMVSMRMLLGIYHPICALS